MTITEQQLQEWEERYQAPESWTHHQKTLRLIAEVRRLREVLNDIVNASRDEGLSAMCNWMRGRAADALADKEGPTHGDA